MAENEPKTMRPGKFRGALSAALDMAREELIETALKVKSVMSHESLENQPYTNLRRCFSII